MSDPSSPGGAGFINKTELATLLSCSLPTVDRLLRQHGTAFPIADKGTNGRAYKFDPEAVVAFLRAREAEAAAAGQARDALVEQYKLPGIQQEPASLSPADLLKLAQLRRMETDEAIRAGFLVDTAKIRALLDDIFARLRREMHAAVRTTLADNAIPEAVIRTIESRINESQTRCIDGLQAALTDGGTASAQPAFL